MFEQNDKESLYLIGVFNEFVFGQELEAWGHDEDPVDAVYDALVWNFRRDSFKTG
jgi:hypothetical protein